MIGDRIRSERKKASMTQEELSKKSGVAKVTISQYEQGKRTPRINKLQLLASALEVPTAFLIGYGNEDGSVADLTLGEIEIKKLGYSPSAAKALSHQIASEKQEVGGTDEYVIDVSKFTGLAPYAIMALVKLKQTAPDSYGLAMRAFSDIIANDDFPLLLTKINTYLYDYSDGITFSFDVQDEAGLSKEQKELLLKSIRESLPAGQFLDILRAIKAENEHR